MARKLVRYTRSTASKKFLYISEMRPGMDVNRVPLQRDTPATYRIRLQGALDESWSDTLQGMTIVVSSEANKSVVTTLTGRLLDQTALSSVLNQVYLLGLPVLSVEQISE